MIYQDVGLSMGTETDGSMSSIVELTLSPETAKALKHLEHLQKRAYFQLLTLVARLHSTHLTR